MSMISNPKLSILIPTRNRGNYISSTVASALSIPNEDIEVIVSENYSDDNTWDLLKAFNDPRLNILRPSKPLSMHENFEYLLDKSTGEWVTFLGDDDAILPSAAKVVEDLSQEYKWCEAICSSRAYFFWPHIGQTAGSVRFSLSNDVKVESSRNFLRHLLDSRINYLYGPQIYSGGFHRRSLLDRVKSHTKHYFHSVIPDASSLVNALSNTFHFVRTGRPLCIVGSSPSRGSAVHEAKLKDRDTDFFDRLHASGKRFSPIFPKFESKTFYLNAAPIYFLEALFNSPSPLVQSLLTEDILNKAILRTYVDLQKRSLLEDCEKLVTFYNKLVPTSEVLEKFKRDFPVIIPDPVEGSTIYQSTSENNFKDILEVCSVIEESCVKLSG